MKMKKHRAKNYLRLLIMASVILWIVTVLSFLGFLKYKGGLRPQASEEGSLLVSASVRVIDENGVGIKSGKITLNRDGLNHYVFGDSSGKFLVNLPSGGYEITIDADGYSSYKSSILLDATSDLSFTLFREASLF